MGAYIYIESRVLRESNHWQKNDPLLWRADGSGWRDVHSRTSTPLGQWALTTTGHNGHEHERHVYWPRAHDVFFFYTIITKYIRTKYVRARLMLICAQFVCTPRERDRQTHLLSITCETHKHTDTQISQWICAFVAVCRVHIRMNRIGCAVLLVAAEPHFYLLEYRVHPVRLFCVVCVCVHMNSTHAKTSSRHNTCRHLCCVALFASITSVI